MNSINISDLKESKSLDEKAMQAVRGGYMCCGTGGPSVMPGGCYEPVWDYPGLPMEIPDEVWEYKGKEPYVPEIPVIAY